MGRTRLISLAALILSIMTTVPSVSPQRYIEPLGIEITTSVGENTLYLPASTSKQPKQMFAILPVKGADGTSGVKIVPSMVEDKVRFDVYLVAGDFNHLTNCEEAKSLPSKLRETRLAKKEQTVVLSGDGWAVSVKAVEKKADPEITDASLTKVSLPVTQLACPCGWGSCGRLKCCPTGRKCIGCGDCGLVCCA